MAASLSVASTAVPPCCRCSRGKDGRTLLLSVAAIEFLLPPHQTFDLLSLVFERTVVSLKRCFASADLKVLLNQEVQTRML